MGAKFLWLFFISWETVALLLPFAVLHYFSGLELLAFEIIMSDFKWAAGGVLAAVLGLLVFSINQCGEIISPKGKRVVLLDWPDYRHLKLTIVVALTQSIAALIFSIIGVVVLFKRSQTGVSFLIGGALQAGVTSISLIAAQWRSRELLRE